MTYWVSIIIPINEDVNYLLHDFIEHYIELSKNFGIQVIISDNSCENTQKFIDRKTTITSIIHLKNDWSDLKTDNHKSLNLKIAFDYCKGDIVVIADSDTRITLDDLKLMYKPTLEGGTSRGGYYYDPYSWVDFIDLSGTWLLNSVTKDKQFRGYQCFSSEYLDVLKTARTDSVFDELTLYRSIANNVNFRYLPKLLVRMVKHTNRTKFFQQRLRYSYEDMAYPIRFIIYLSIIPSIVFSFCFNVEKFILLLYFLLPLLFSYIGYRMQKDGTAKYKWPIVAILFSPLYVFQHAIISWLVLIFKRNKGIIFSGSLLKKPS